MLHRASRDQGQGRVEIFSAHNSGQLVEVGRRFADIARTVAGGTAPCSPLNTTVSREPAIHGGQPPLGGLPPGARPL